MISSLLHGHYKEDIELVLVTNVNNPVLHNINIANDKIREIIPFRFVSTLNWFAGTSPWCSKSGIMNCINILRKILKPFLLMHQTAFFTRLFREEKFDALLNMNGGYPGSISSRAAALAWTRLGTSGRQVMAIHNFASPSRFGMRSIDRIIDQKVTSALDEIITVSESCRRSFVNRPSLDSHSKITVIPNGIASKVRDFDKREKLRMSLGVKNDQIFILMLGTYEKRKGHKFLIESFTNLVKSLPSARLVCAGDDPNLMIRRLELQIVKLGLEESVKFLGFQSDVSGLLEACDIVAIPSQLYESFCLVAVEAFRFAKPIVGTNVGAIPEIAPNGFGAVLCDPNDARAFSDALLQLSTNKVMYSEFSQASGIRYKQFGVERMVLSYQDSVMGKL